MPIQEADADEWNILLLNNAESTYFCTSDHWMNFRMTDLQCAVGVAQLKKFEEILRIKKANYDLYYSKLNDIDEISFIDVMEYSNFVPFRVNIKVKKQPELVNYLESNGIQTRGFFYLLHRQPCFSYLRYESDEFEVSNRLNQTGLSYYQFIRV